jgi:hypothetical protein
LDVEIEDEVHFLDVCPAYDELRRNILTPAAPGIAGNQILQREPEIMAKYLRAAEELRDHALRPWIINHTSLCSMKITLSKKKDNTARVGKPLPLRVTERTEKGLKFKISRHKRRKTSPVGESN